MKNTELLVTTRADLDPIEKQRRYILRCLVQQNSCPNCGHMLNFFDGAGIDIDTWQDKAGGVACTCTNCRRSLKYVVPFLVLGGNGGWHWHLVPIDPATSTPTQS